MKRRERYCELTFCTMPLPSILKKASSFILGETDQDHIRAMYQDGETLFCKNNVCVHPPTLIRQHCDVIHHPGYLTILCKVDKITGVPNLNLSWIPNSTLRKHPNTLENSTLKKDPYKEIEPLVQEPGKMKIDDKIDGCLEAKETIDCKDCERVCSGGYVRPKTDLPEIIMTVNGNGPNDILEKNGLLKNNLINNEKKTINKIVRSESEENFKERDDNTSIKSRSLSLTSTNSMSLIGSGDGKFIFFF